MRIRTALAVVVLSAGLAACNTTGIGTLLGASVANPVTPERAAALHATFVAVVVIPAGRYSKLPRCSVHPTPPCSSTRVVRKLRSLVNPAAERMHQLDLWAAGNTTLNGVALYQAASEAIDTIKQFNAANGVK